MKSDSAAEFEKRIRERLAELDSEDAAASGSRDRVMLDQQSVGRLSRMDALQQQAMAQATHQRRQQERTRLHAALSRIADGEYGECLDCGEDIEPARLRLNPALTLCRDCARGA